MTRPATTTLHAPTRRTLTRAAAWTVPAIAVASAAPSFAVTLDCSVFTAAASCVEAGNGAGITFTMSSSKAIPKDATITITRDVFGTSTTFPGSFSNTSTGLSTSTPGTNWSSQVWTVTANPLAANTSLQFAGSFSKAKDGGSTTTYTLSITIAGQTCVLATKQAGQSGDSSGNVKCVA